MSPYSEEETPEETIIHIGPSPTHEETPAPEEFSKLDPEQLEQG